MNISYKPPFRRFVKKQSRSLQLVIEDEVEIVSQDPFTGEGKKGDLAGFRVHKFSFQRQNFLIAYQSQSDGLVFYTVGSHENFYRELKNYLKEIG